MSRPEHIAPAEIFYNEEEAKKYSANSRMIYIQSQMTERAIQLLGIPTDSPPLRFLDIGCGSGLSGAVLTNLGHNWVGVDISPSMLGVARQREAEGDVICLDMGHGLPFRPGSFDGVISISAVQWLCNADKKEHVPQRRLITFFKSLYKCLQQGAPAVFQLYPEGTEQLEMITNAAMKSGFSGGVVVDYPNSTKARKIFLVLSAGEPRGRRAAPVALDGPVPDGADMDEHDDDDIDNEHDSKAIAASSPSVPSISSSSSSSSSGAGVGVTSTGAFGFGLLPAASPDTLLDNNGSNGNGNGDTVIFSGTRDNSNRGRRERARSRKGNRGGVKEIDRDWIQHKKERQRAQGKKVARDSKYMARRRKPTF